MAPPDGTRTGTQVASGGTLYYYIIIYVPFNRHPFNASYPTARPMITWGLAILIGVSLGMLGGGGSVLTVPVFVYAAGFDPKTAIAMSFPVVGAASFVGAVTYWRAGVVMPRIAIAFGLVTMGGAVAGARLSTLVSGTTQLMILAVAIIAAAISMLRPTPAVGSGDAGPTQWRDMLRPSVVAAGLAVGVLTGLVGIGGGFLIVPALVVLARVPMRAAVGTSLAVIAMNSSAAFAAHAATTAIPVTFVATFTAVAILGVVGGARAAHAVPAGALRRAFAILLLAVGAAILYQNRGVFTATAISTSFQRTPA